MNNLTATNQPEKLTPELSTVQLANAATQRPGDSSRCEQLLQDIKVLSQGGGSVSYTKYKRYFTNQSDPTQKFNGVITKSISQRYAELIVDKNNLWNIRPTGTDSYQGHQTYLRNQQTALAAALLEFAETCNEDNFTREQNKILGQGRIAIKTPIPLAPDLRLRELIRQPNIDWKQVASVIIDILKQAGVVSWAVLTAIAAAIVSAISFFLTPSGRLGHTPLSEKDVAQLINGKEPLSQSLFSSSTVTSQSSNSSLSEALSILDKMKKGNSSSFTSASSSHNPDIAAGLNILDQIKKDLQKDKEPALSNIADKDSVVLSKSRDNGIGGR